MLQDVLLVVDQLSLQPHGGLKSPSPSGFCLPCKDFLTYVDVTNFPVQALKFGNSSQVSHFCLPQSK